LCSILSIAVRMPSKSNYGSRLDIDQLVLQENIPYSSAKNILCGKLLANPDSILLLAFRYPMEGAPH